MGGLRKAATRYRALAAGAARAVPDDYLRLGLGLARRSGRAPRRAEVFIKAAAPGRRMEFRRVIPAGNVVTLEATIVDAARPGWELSWCGIYTFDREGRIVSDHSYLNRNDWPGIGDLLAKAKG